MNNLFTSLLSAATLSTVATYYRRVRVALAGLALTAVALAARGEYSEYSVTYLGSLGGLSSALGVNNKGEVVGQAALLARDVSPVHAFLYSGGIMRDLGTLAGLGGCGSWANSINDNGQIVGGSVTPGSCDAYGSHAFLYSGGVMMDLGTLGGSSSEATAINNNGQIVGYSYLAGDVTFHAFLYSGGVMTDLGALGGSNSAAYGINDSGQIVGDLDQYSGPAGPRGKLHYEVDVWEKAHAFLYSGGSMTDLGFLGLSSSHATSINNNGQIVGFGLTSSNWYVTFLYSGGMTTVFGKDNTPDYPTGINDRGQLAGCNLDYDTAYLYGNETMAAIDSLILSNAPSRYGDELWQIYWAIGINDSGQVAASGTYHAGFPDGTNGAVLLTPIPPRLSIAPAGKQVALSWSTNAIFTYTLQSNTNLLATNWFDVAASAALTNGAFEVTLPATGSANFYRMKW